MSQTRIKICGITNVETAQAAIDAGADAIGLVFAQKSPRKIDIETAFEIADVVPPFVTVVGLFQIASANDPDLEEWWGEWAQLHGSEDESLVMKVAESHKVIRGFKFDPKEVSRWDSCADVEALLIDGSPGGRGEGFDHTKLAAMRSEITKPIILAGGLNAGNVGDAIRAVQPWAVDVSSGVEIEPGVKHPKLIRAFCEAVRRAE